MFSSASSFIAVVASVHSLFSFVAATPDPFPTPAPDPTPFNKRQVAGAPGTPILSTIQIPYTALPEQVYPYAVLRGPQSGYNICNSTTQGAKSLCQTLLFNSLVRFSHFPVFQRLQQFRIYRATFAYGVQLFQMAPSETKKPAS